MKSTLTELGAPPATGMLLLADGYSKLTQRDGLIAFITALILLFTVTLIDLRNFKFTILFFIPLILGIGGVLGVLVLIGHQLNTANLLIFPLLFGIGIDDIVHISHSYRASLALPPGERLRVVIGETGTAVLMTTVTTVLSAVTMITSSSNTILHYLGTAMAAGLILAFLFTLFFYEPLLHLLVTKLLLKITPWGSR